jgi:CHASE3 domain sensor protein
MNSSPLSLESFNILFHRGHLRSVGMQILIVAVVLLLSAVLLLGVNVTKLQESFAWVQETNNELIQISEVDKRLVGNELTVRGYALTDDPIFLTYRQDESRQMNAAIAKLGVLLADDPDMTQDFAELRSLVKQRLDLFTYLINLGPGHAQDVAASIRDPKYRAIMRAARAKVEEMRGLELKQLAEQQAAAAQQAKSTYRLAIGIVVLSFVFGALGLAFALIGRDRR